MDRVWRYIGYLDQSKPYIRRYSARDPAPYAINIKSETFEADAGTINDFTNKNATQAIALQSHIFMASGLPGKRNCLRNLITRI
jgi:hypothetical protein